MHELVVFAADGGGRNPELLAAIVAVISAAAAGTAVAAHIRYRKQIAQQLLRIESLSDEIERHRQANAAYAPYLDRHGDEPTDEADGAAIRWKLNRAVRVTTRDDLMLNHLARSIEGFGHSLRRQGRRNGWMGWLFFGLGTLTSVGVSLVFWLLGAPG